MASSIFLMTPIAPPPVSSARGMRPVDGLARKVIGFVDNSKPNFNNLVDDIVDLLASRYGVRSIVHRKRLASIPAPDDAIEDLVQQCDVVITGSGD